MKIKNSCNLDCAHCKHQCYRSLHMTSIDRIRKEAAKQHAVDTDK